MDTSLRTDDVITKTIISVLKNLFIMVVRDSRKGFKEANREGILITRKIIACDPKIPQCDLTRTEFRNRRIRTEFSGAFSVQFREVSLPPCTL